MKPKKPLPKQAILGLIVGGALLVGVIGYMLLIKPQGTELASVKSEIAATRNTITTYEQEAAQSKPTAVPHIKVADIYRLAQAMPDTVDMPDLVLELNDVAQASGVTIDSISPIAPTPGNGFELVPLNLTFHGDYYQITDYLYRLRTLVDVQHGQLEAGGRLFAVETIALAPGAAAAGSADTAAASSAAVLQATVKLDAFVHGTVATAGTGTSAPAVPPTTDTTATTSTTSPTASAEGAP